MEKTMNIKIYKHCANCDELNAVVRMSCQRCGSVIFDDDVQQKQYAVMVEGKQTPSKLHETYESAENEAKRITQQEKRTTYILQAIAKLELNDIKITKL